MQIVIPMSGFGERFRKVGFKSPKPLIEIEGKPIISHVIDMFPGEKNFFFICNQEHLDEPSYAMHSILKEYCPTGKVIGIQPHKLGPVNAVLQIVHLLNPSEPVIVNYCDFSCFWSWQKFKKFVKKTECVGAIPSYKGFHPHSLGTTNYAYIREINGWVFDIQEKKPFTDDRMQEYASSGTYYFSKGSIMTQAFHEVIKQGLDVAGEFYVSLAYKPLLEAKKCIAVYPLQHFMQWGTPEDVYEYRAWSRVFKRLISKTKKKYKALGSLVLPMAGLGQRFLDEGYKQTKPLIPVSGRSMVVQAVNDLPPANQHVFIIRSDMKNYDKVIDELRALYPNAIVKLIEEVTEGQACSAQLGIDALNKEVGNDRNTFTIGACDNGVIYNEEKFYQLLENPSIDIIIWCIRGYPNAIRNPNMFGWIDTVDGSVKSISVKKPLSDSTVDPIVLGTFTFKKLSDFRRCLNRLVERDGRVNGEFYIDSLINDAIAMGLRCHIFEVDEYLCWGTPNDLRTFEYWQSCFHKWKTHPYNLTLDYRIPKNQIKSLRKKYKTVIPTLPKVI